MANIIATGSKTIIDLTDGKVLSIYLGTNLPRTQIYDVNEGTYSIDWSVGSNLQITPVIYINQTPVSIVNSALALTWQRKVSANAPTALETASGETVTDGVLKVTQNKMSLASANFLTYIVSAVYADPETGVNVTAEADVSFSLVGTGANAKSVDISGEQVFKYAAGATTPSPANIILTATAKNTNIQKWQYLNASSVWTDIAASNGATSITVGPATANYWTNNPNLCRIKVLADGGAISDVFTITKIQDGSHPITGYLTSENTTLTASKTGVVSNYAPASGIFKVYNGVTEVTAAAVHSITGGTDGGTSFTKAQGGLTLTLVKSSGAYSFSATTWSTDSESFSVEAVYGGITLVKSLTISKSKAGIDGEVGGPGADAKYVVVNGEQMFKYTTDSATPTPTSITLSAELFGGLTGYSWQYWNGTAWANLSTPQNAVTYTLTHNNAAWGVKTQLRIRCISGAQYDETTIVKVSDGAGSINVTLSNEAHTMSANAAGIVSSYVGSGTAITVYDGVDKLNYVTAAPGNGQWKVAVSTTGITASSIPATGGTTAAFGNFSNMTADSAIATYTITGKRKNGADFIIIETQTFSRTRNAVAYSIYAPLGTVFENHTGSNKSIAISAYDGPTAITAATSYAWHKFVSGGWVSMGTASTQTVTPADVTGTLTIRGVMTYGGQSYTDFITFTDKTDNYQAVIESTGGDVFKNTVGSTFLVCRLWQNGLEVDAPKMFGTTLLGSQSVAPTGPAAGYFYYYNNSATNNNLATLKKYSGSAWVNATGTDLPSRTYKWYKRDKDGVPSTTSPYAEGKVIFIDGDDVTDKATFTCEVE